MICCCKYVYIDADFKLDVQNNIDIVPIAIHMNLYVRWNCVLNNLCRNLIYCQCWNDVIILLQHMFICVWIIIVNVCMTYLCFFYILFLFNIKMFKREQFYYAYVLTQNNMLHWQYCKFFFITVLEQTKYVFVFARWYCYWYWYAKWTIYW